MKYFLTSLDKLASTLDDAEKVRVEKLTLQFWNQHCYFSRTWKMLNDQQQGKGVIFYEKINFIDSLNIKPENGIFLSKDEFYSTLKGTAVGDDEYNNSKILFT